MRVVVGRVREADAGEESKFHTELGILSLCICLPHDWWITIQSTDNLNSYFRNAKQMTKQNVREAGQGAIRTYRERERLRRRPTRSAAAS